jgi:hypothetical protein
MICLGQGVDNMRKPIKGFEGLYEISDKGEVITLKKELPTPTTKYILKERKSKGYKNQQGYLVFDFRRRGGKCVLVHRLVAEAFIPNPNNYPQINHKDGNKQNNNVDNLEWCNNSVNQLHAFKNNLNKGNFEHHNSKLTYDEVIYIKNNYQKGVFGFGIRSLANKFNVCDSTIKQIISGKSYKNIK